MKKLFCVVISVLIVINCKAQKRLEAGKVTVKNHTFSVTAYQSVVKGSPRAIVISNIENKYRNGIPSPKPGLIPMGLHDIHIDFDQIKQIAYNVLKPKWKDLKNNSEKMNILLVLKQDGSMWDVSFGLNENTLVTAEEIEQIDSKIRSGVRATFTGKRYLQYEAISYSALPTIKFDPIEKVQ